MASSSTIERQAIGRRNGFIGSLYDVRTDEFEGGSLFKKELPSSCIKINDCANTNYWLDFHNSQKETFNKLDIEANLKLALMAGLINVEGSAKYLEQTKTNNHTVRVTFMYRAKTKEEYLQISTGNLNEYFSEYAFKNPNVTHVVIGIVWGINVAATFERTVESADAVQRIEGTLSAAFKKPIFSIKGQATIDYDDKNKSDLDSLKVEFSGDVLIDNCPQTVEGVLKVCENIPSQIESLNDGKGRQLVFILYPLKSIAQMFESELKIERSIKEVSEAIVSRIEDMFEQIIESKRKLNDFIYDIEPWKEFISYHWFDLVKQKQRELDQESLITQRKLKDLLVKIRSDSAKESEMQQLLDEFESNNPCSLTSIERFLKDNQKIKRKIDTLTKVSPEKKELLKILESVDDLILDLYDYDVYLLHTCEEWNTKENKRSTLKQERYFTNLMKNELISNNTKARFRVIDHDLHPELEEKPNSCVIYHAKNGHIVTRDFYEYSLKKLSKKDRDYILKENSTLTRRSLLDRHKEFMEANRTGELSKDDFKNEFKKLFPKGNSESFSDYVFPTIDGDKGGKISFPEFMKAVALTQTEDLDIGLSLVFFVCDYEHSKEINASRIIEFIEVVAELHAGETAVDTNKAKSIAMKIMDYCQKTKDGTVTEMEFIQCGKNDIDISIAFLPQLKCNQFYGNIINIHPDAQWQQDGITVSGGNGQGNAFNQLSYPWGLYVDDDETIYVADYSNHRITKWIAGETSGKVVAGGKGPGDGDHQLSYPYDVIVDKKTDSLIISDSSNRRVVRWPRRYARRGETIISDIACWGLTMDQNGSLYVVDNEKHEVRRYQKGESQGTIVAGGNGCGDRLDQLSNPRYVFVDQDFSVYVSEWGNNRVTKWIKGEKTSIVVAGNQESGNNLTQLILPKGVVVDQLDTVYVVDDGNDRVMRWPQGASQGSIIAGGNGRGEQSNQLNGPVGLSFDRHGNLYVVDYKNHRVQKFNIESNK